MLKKLSILLLFSSYPIIIKAAWTIGVENYSRHIGKIQTDDLGSSNFLEFNPGIGLGKTFRFPQYMAIKFFPSATIFFPESTPDNLLNKITGEFNFHFIYDMSKHFYVLFGTSYQLIFLSGSGGTVALDNGNSTASYYVPASSEFANYIVPEIGLGISLTANTSFGANLIIHQILNSQRRTFSFSFNFNYWFTNE